MTVRAYAGYPRQDLIFYPGARALGTMRVIFGWMRSKAGQPDGQCGAVTFLWSAHRTRSVTVIADR